MLFDSIKLTLAGQLTLQFAFGYRDELLLPV